MVSARSLTTTADAFASDATVGGSGDHLAAARSHVLTSLSLRTVWFSTGLTVRVGKLPAWAWVRFWPMVMAVPLKVASMRPAGVKLPTRPPRSASAMRVSLHRGSLGKKRSGGPPDSRGTRNKRCGRRGEGGVRCLGHVGGGGLLTPRGSAKRVNGTRGHV